MVRAVGENTFQPKIGFKTRYGMVSNPFVGVHLQTDLHLTEQTNTTEKLKFLTFFNRSKKVSTFKGVFFKTPFFMH